MRKLLFLALLAAGLGIAQWQGHVDLSRVTSFWKISYGFSRDFPLGRLETLDPSFQTESKLKRMGAQYFHMGSAPGQDGPQTYPPEFRPESLAPGLAMYEYVDEDTLQHEVVQCVRLVAGPGGRVVAVMGYIPWTGTGPSAPRYRSRVGRLMLELWNEAVPGEAPFQDDVRPRHWPEIKRARVQGERVSGEWIMSPPNFEKIYLKLAG